MSKTLFVGTVCQKGFRLEAALAHHYQAKHNMDMPSATPAASATTSAATPAAGGASSTDASSSSTAASAPAATPSTAPPAAQGGGGGQSYTHGSEATAPQPPQYHLDVAPNAPEESEIAAHARCVNHMMLVGQAQDVQQGFVFEEPVVQFVVATDFEGPAPGEPDRDFHTVRVFGEALGKQVTAQLAAGLAPRVLVSGRLRLVPQYEQATTKYYHFPVVHVHEGSGFVRSV